MTKLSLTVLATMLLAGSALAATECPANVTTNAIALITNATFLNTCAPGSTWKLTTLLETANMTAADFLTFCNATTCLHPVHEVHESIPDGCVATVNGASVVLSEAVGGVHTKCHDAVHKAEAGHHAAGSNASAATNSSGGAAKTVPAPEAKKSDATTVAQAATVAVAMVASTIAAIVL